MKYTGKWAVFVAAAVLAFDVAAFAQTQLGTQPKSEMSPTAQAAAQDKTATSRYVHDAAMADMFEVQAGKLAIGKSHNADVKDFARMMVKDHTASTKKLKAAIAESKVSIKPPTKLDSAHGKLLDQLKVADASKFDRLYMDMQVKGHNEALALHKGYAASGKIDAIKKAAGEIQAVVAHHLEVANKVASEVAAPPA